MGFPYLLFQSLALLQASDDNLHQFRQAQIAMFGLYRSLGASPSLVLLSEKTAVHCSTLLCHVDRNSGERQQRGFWPGPYALELVTAAGPVHDGEDLGCSS